MNVLCVIPARYASTRLPGKPLKDIAGKPMICRVYERAAKASRVAAAIVATDDSRIYDAVLQHGGSGLGIHPVPEHHVVTAHPDFAGLTWRSGRVVVAQDFPFKAPHGNAY